MDIAIECHKRHRELRYASRCRVAHTQLMYLAVLLRLPDFSRELLSVLAYFLVWAVRPEYLKQHFEPPTGHHALCSTKR